MLSWREARLPIRGTSEEVPQELIDRGVRLALETPSATRRPATPTRRRTEKGPKIGPAAALEPAGLLSNPDLASTLAHLREALSDRLANETRGENRPQGNPASQGQVLGMIKAILSEHPEGLHVSEVRSIVEERLGRELSRSTVKEALAEHSGTGGMLIGPSADEGPTRFTYSPERGACRRCRGKCGAISGPRFLMTV
jgi:hypothetical protein